MALLRENQVKRDITPTKPDTGLMRSFDKERRQSVEAVGDFAKVIENQVLTYEEGQKNIGRNVINSAQKIYRDDPKAFDKYVNQEFQKVEKDMTDEQKVRYRSYMQMQLEPARMMVNQNNTLKIDRQNKETSQEAASTIFSNTVQNIGLLDTPENMKITGQLGQLENYANEKDRKGNYIQTPTMRSKVRDLIDNQGYYAYLSKTNQMRAEGDVVTLKEMRVELEKDKKGYIKKYGDENYTDLLDATKTKGVKVDPLLKAETTAEINAMYRELDLGYDDKGDMVMGEGVEPEEVGEAIVKLETEFKNGLVNNSVYASKINKLKSAYYNEETKDKKYNKRWKIAWGSPETVGSMALEMVENLNQGIGSKLKTDAKKFDEMMFINNTFKENNIDMKSNDISDKNRARLIVESAELMLLKQKGATDDDLKTKASKEVFIQKVKADNAIKEIKEQRELFMGEKDPVIMGILD